MNASNISNDVFAGAGTARLLKYARKVRDFRMDRRRKHVLADVLFIAVCAVMAGFGSYYEMAMFGECKAAWLRSVGLELPNGIPSHDTFRRILSLTPPGTMKTLEKELLGDVRGSLAGDTVAIDGKVTRGAPDKEGRLPCIVSGLATHARLVVGSRRTDEKSNETTAIPQLLKELPVRGAVVTVDAAGCHRENARLAREALADYVFALKGNQGTMEREMRLFMEDIAAGNPEGDVKETEKKRRHGRLEVRRLWQSHDLGWFADKDQWKDLATVAMVESERTAGGATTVERRLYISSLKTSPGKMLGIIRSHWHVETRLHWVLDVDFGEDKSRARWKYAAENLSTLRHFAVNRHMHTGNTDVGIRRKIKKASISDEYMGKLVMAM